jgi:integrase
VYTRLGVLSIPSVAGYPRRNEKAPVSLDGAPSVDRPRKTQAAERLAASTAYRDGDYIFARADGSPCQPKTLAYRFQVLAREAELPVIRLHDGRHTSATWGLLTGENILVTSKRLGHARPQTTQEIYQHVLDGLQEQAAERRAALLTHPTATREAGS